MDNTKRGRPSSGLDKALLIRCSEELVSSLDAMLARKRDGSPGLTISRSDVVREILHEAVAADSSAQELAEKLVETLSVKEKA